MDQDEFEAARAEIERRVAAGRADGRYPATLDAELASHFARLAKDRLWFSGNEAARQAIGGVRGFGFDNAMPVASALPGGEQLHRLVGKLVSRSVNSIVGQLNVFSGRVESAFDAVGGALDELRSVITLDVLGDLDALHGRVVELEARVAQLEAAAEQSVAP